MRKYITLLVIASAACLLSAFSGNREVRPTWADEFDGTSFDTTAWAKISRGSSPWDSHMAFDDK